MEIRFFLTKENAQMFVRKNIEKGSIKHSLIKEGRFSSDGGKTFKNGWCVTFDKDDKPYHEAHLFGGQ